MLTSYVDPAEIVGYTVPTSGAYCACCVAASLLTMYLYVANAFLFNTGKSRASSFIDLPHPMMYKKKGSPSLYHEGLFG